MHLRSQFLLQYLGIILENAFADAHAQCLTRVITVDFCCIYIKSLFKGLNFVRTHFFITNNRRIFGNNNKPLPESTTQDQGDKLELFRSTKVSDTHIGPRSRRNIFLHDFLERNGRTNYQDRSHVNSSNRSPTVDMNYQDGPHVRLI